VITRPYPSSNWNSLVTRLYYGPCDQGTEVIADSIRTGGHEWPMNTNDRINNSEETWAFLKKFSLQTTTDIHQRTFSMTSENLFASYSSGIIRLQGTGENHLVRVIDTRGKLVACATAIHRQFAFKDKPSGVYVIMISGNERNIALGIAVP
jgi:hypothetical protein